MAMAVKASKAQARLMSPAVGRRLGQLLVLALVGALVVAMEVQPIPWVQTNFFALLYAYVAFALWFGDRWEGRAAVASMCAAAGVLVFGFDRGALFRQAYTNAPTYNLHSSDAVAWLIFVTTAIALTALVNRRRGSAGYPGPDAAPVVPADLQNPVLVIHGHAQLVQGAGVVFDTRQGGHATQELAWRSASAPAHEDRSHGQAR